MMNNGINCVKRSTPLAARRRAAGSDIWNLRRHGRVDCRATCAGRHSDSRLAPAHAVYAVARVAVGRGARARVARSGGAAERPGRRARDTRTDGANRLEAVDPAGRGTGDHPDLSRARAEPVYGILDFAR